MWKLIIKNLWNRRKKNGWLLAELILVSVVTWAIMDPVIVLMHDKSLPLGYDSDRLCLIDVATLDASAAQYNEQATDSGSISDNYFRLVAKVKSRPEVEQAAPLLSFTYINSSGSSTSTYYVDSLSQNVYHVYFLPGHHFFETYGIKTVPGSPSAEELSKANYGPSDMVVTKNLAGRLLRDKAAPGKELYVYSEEDTISFRLLGIVEDIRNYSCYRATPIVFMPEYKISTYAILNDQTRILVRLKPGVSQEKFLNDIRPWMVKEMRAGNQFGRSISSYSEMQELREFYMGVTNKMRLNVALAIFFLINLCLGVIGTFWMQTRKRNEEAGVMRSFGASPHYIVRLLLGEGFVICTLAYAVGCLCYWNYAMGEGLYQGDGNQSLLIASDYWVASFGTHFVGVSAIVYLIILAVVTIGIYIPAYRISRVNPVDALRDE